MHLVTSEFIQQGDIEREKFNENDIPVRLHLDFKHLSDETHGSKVLVTSPTKVISNISLTPAPIYFQTGNDG